MKTKILLKEWWKIVYSILEGIAAVIVGLCLLVFMIILPFVVIFGLDIAILVYSHQGFNLVWQIFAAPWNVITWALAVAFCIAALSISVMIWRRYWSWFSSQFDENKQKEKKASVRKSNYFSTAN